MANLSPFNCPTCLMRQKWKLKGRGPLPDRGDTDRSYRPAGNLKQRKCMSNSTCETVTDDTWQSWKTWWADLSSCLLNVNLAGKSVSNNRLNASHIWNLTNEVWQCKTKSHLQWKNTDRKLWQHCDFSSGIPKFVTVSHAAQSVSIYGQSLARWWLFHFRLTGSQFIRQTKKMSTEQATASEHQLPSEESQTHWNSKMAK